MPKMTLTLALDFDDATWQSMNTDERNALAKTVVDAARAVTPVVAHRWHLPAKIAQKIAEARDAAEGEMPHSSVTPEDMFEGALDDIAALVQPYTF